MPVVRGSDVTEVLHLPYTRVLERALGWMTLNDVRECAARVAARGGRLSSMLGSHALTHAHPDRVHAILTLHTRDPKPLFEVRLWSRSAQRSFGYPLDLEADEAAGFPRHPDPIYHELIARRERGFCTE